MKKINGKKALSLVAGAIAAANLSMGAVNAEREFDAFGVHFICDDAGVRSADGRVMIPRGVVEHFSNEADGFSYMVSGDGWAQAAEEVCGIAVTKVAGIWYVMTAEGKYHIFNEPDEINGELTAYDSEDETEVCICCTNTTGRPFSVFKIAVNQFSLTGEWLGYNTGAFEVAGELNDMLERYLNGANQRESI